MTFECGIHANYANNRLYAIFAGEPLANAGFAEEL
jgi:hypothetical protein